MRPECALEGTCTINPSVELARCAVGELRAMRAFRLWGNATTMPVFNSVPLISSSPRWETWCGWVEQWAAGTHEALAMLTPWVLLGGCATWRAGVDLPGAVVPPELASAEGASVSASERANRTTVDLIEVLAT